MSEYKPKPLYMPWNEEEFLADMDVRLMNSAQRGAYRTLLQSLFWQPSRPFVLNNPKVLQLSAGCDSAKDWAKVKEKVLAKFVKFEIGGMEYLEHPRVTRDWDRIQSERDKMSELGRRSADVKRSLNGGLTDAQLVSEGKGSEERERKKESAPCYGAASIPEPGQLGYYNPESSSTQSTKVIHKRCAEAWQTVKGTRSAVCRSLDLPNIKGDWEAMCSNHPADLIVAAFELWASEVGLRENTQWPLSKFFSRAQEYMDKVEQINGISRKVNPEAQALAETAVIAVQDEEQARVRAAEEAAAIIDREIMAEVEKREHEEQTLEETQRMLRELSQ